MNKSKRAVPVHYHIQVEMRMFIGFDVWSVLFVCFFAPVQMHTYSIDDLGLANERCHLNT